MLGHIFSKLFKNKECITINPSAKKSESSLFKVYVFEPIALIATKHQQLTPHFTKVGQRLIFIDSHLTENELKEMYGDAINS